MVILLVFSWMRHEEKRTVGEDRRLEGERAAIREREVALAARLASERGEALAVTPRVVDSGVSSSSHPATGIGLPSPIPHHPVAT